MRQPAADDRIPLRGVPDLRGTPAQDASGVGVGRLWGSLAEADTGLLRYLDLQLDSRPRHVLVPIGHARLREQQGTPAVRLRAALLEDLEAVPEYDPAIQQLDDRYEHDLLALHGRAYHGEHYYAHPAFDHSSLYAGAHPILRYSAQPPGEVLLPLSQLTGYRVARGEPDIRGWELAGFAEASLGRITDLVVDPGEEKVRYVVVDAGARQVLVPVGFLSIDAQAGVVRAASLFSDDVAVMPAYVGGSVDRGVEEATRAVLLGQLRGHRRYQLPDYSPRALAGG
jgi:hypothetical protein